ncbi:MAG TPA: site-specific integrase [Clostridiaceae bacterium]|jgi:integrase|nr:site-specific integrase [Clostridia bacterium]HJJ17893.1 site-specific integrase [Clostridiaceae bacterium]
MAGSIEKRGKNSYRLTVSEGFDLNGKPMIHRKTVHGTKKDAEVELAKFVTEVQNGLVIDGKSLKFYEFTEIWKRDYGSKELAPSTYKRYCRMLETRLLQYFGHFYINKIKPTDIMKFYDLLEKDTQLVRKKGNNGSKTKKPLSGKTILEHHRLLRAMLHKAVYWQLIVANPAERVQPPKARKPKRRSYDDEQTKILLENLELLSSEDTKYKVAIILTVFTGVRLGELMGLEWQDVDFKNGIISINRSSQYLSDMGVFTKVPKTESSIREIAIPEFIISLLEEYKLWYEEQKSVYGELWTNSDRLFVQADGKPMHPSTISKWFVKYVGQIGLPVINFHGLRHTNASLLVAQNIDIAVISARLGHAQISTTLDFYVHPLLSHNRKAGYALENLLLPTRS